MATFQRKYSDEQKAAAVGAVLDFGLSSRQAVDAAAAGNLPGRWASLEPFQMPEATLKAYAVDERRRRRKARARASEPRQLLDRAVGELATLLDQQMERARGRSASGKLETAEIRELAAATREVARVIKETGGVVTADGGDGSSGDSDGTGEGAADPGQDFIGSLAAEPGETLENNTTTRVNGATV